MKEKAANMDAGNVAAYLTQFSRVPGGIQQQIPDNTAPLKELK